MSDTPLRLPSFWKGMSFTAKAAHLCTTKQAKDYSDACRILGSMKKKRVTPRRAEVAPQSLWYLRD